MSSNNEHHQQAFHLRRTFPRSGVSRISSVIGFANHQGKGEKNVDERKMNYILNVILNETLCIREIRQCNKKFTHNIVEQRTLVDFWKSFFQFQLFIRRDSLRFGKKSKNGCRKFRRNRWMRYIALHCIFCLSIFVFFSYIN